ncbi:flagellar motor switch protein FliN [Demequina sp.]|uniref:flagellar motor switch protein FliN n=1 Tax=Demequina sp. TaxID=2050685 RepID=UPI003A84335B
MTTTEPSSVAHAAAGQAALHLPTAMPLSVAAFAAASAPAPQTLAVRAHHVGAESVDLVIVTGPSTHEALAAAGDGALVEDLLRPALEAAASTLGPGVLDAARTEPVGAAFDDPDIEAFALVDDAGQPQAWFGLRTRTAQPAGSEPPAVLDAVTERARLRVLHDIELVLTAEIGRTRLPMRDVLGLVPGTVIELDRAAGAPADIMVNGRLVARGEVVVIDEDYGVRVTEIVTSDHGG